MPFYRQCSANYSMNWSLRDAVFTGLSFGDYATSLVREWKVYYSLVFWHRWRWCQGPCPISRFGVWRVSGAFSDVLSHCGIGVCFSFWYRWDSWRQEDTIALKQFKVRVSWLKIVDKAAWNFKFQKSCFSLS